MSLLNKLLNRSKSLSDLSPAELRKEEIMIQRQREKLFRRIEELGTAKQRIFKQGAEQKSPQLRSALAMEFDLRSQEQVLASRELNVRSKELLTVSRVRMVKDAKARGSAGLGRLNLTDRDVARISGWLTDDSVNEELYSERLDELLEIGQAADDEALANASVGEAGKGLLDVWAEMDRGEVGSDKAFNEADAAARRRAESQGG